MNFETPKFRFTEQNIPTSKGKLRWKSPSNIAIVKYWGKHSVQLPRNPSISFTLRDAATTTEFEYSPRYLYRSGEPIQLHFKFDGEPNEAFRVKQAKFLDSLEPYFPYLMDFELSISSTNSFPHSAGIASSASSMSALAMCLCEMECQLTGREFDEKMLQKASFIARLGSGSACRSLFPTMAVWGETAAVAGSSDFVAVPFEPHSVFKTYHNSILIAGRGEKTVSSRMGHGLMDNNAYAPARYAQANQRLETLISALKSGDIPTFGQILEDEAMTLHALMMTTSPYFTLLKPNTLAIIERLRQFRADTDLPVYFTLDAGPNPHLLYPDSVAEAVQSFIKSDLAQLCENNQWIADRVGNGAERF